MTSSLGTHFLTAGPLRLAAAIVGVQTLGAPAHLPHPQGKQTVAVTATASAHIKEGKQCGDFRKPPKKRLTAGLTRRLDKSHPARTFPRMPKLTADEQDAAIEAGDRCISCGEPHVHHGRTPEDMKCPECRFGE